MPTPLILSIPTDFSVLSAEELDLLETQATEAAGPLLEKTTSGESLTDAELATLEQLGSVVTQAADARSQKFAATVVDGAKTKRAADAAAAFANAKPKADAADGDDAGEDDKDEPEGDGDEVAPKGGPRVGDVADKANKGGAGGAVVPPSEEVKRYSSLVAAPNLPSTPANSVFGNLDAVAAEMVEVMRTFSTLGEGQYQRVPVLRIQRNYPDELTLSGDKSTEEEILRALDFAADETRLPGGSLVAAAGWCAPSETDYGLLEIEAIDGILSLPEVQIRRGGINYTIGPDFAAIFGGTGYFHQTEAQVIAATAKTCMVVPCPSFTDVRLEVDGVCITGAFLQDRGYPEMVARFVRGALVAHAHKLNIFVINKLVAGSTLFDYTNVANMAVTTSEYKDLTTLSRLLAIIGTQIMDIRYKYRMRKDASLEAVLPYWVVESVRADIQRRAGLDPQTAFNLGIAQIEQWFAVRGAKVQWVYDWLDTYNATNPSVVGQTAGIYTLPTQVDVLLYPAGTWVKGVADVVRLDNVYDSTNLVLNQYVRLFSEEGILVAKRGYESRRIRVAISPSGATAATVDMRTG
jgi:hypothetical protein